MGVTLDRGTGRVDVWVDADSSGAAKTRRERHEQSADAARRLLLHAFEAHDGGRAGFRVEHDAGGRPCAAGAAGARRSVSLAHAVGVAACAVADEGATGIDVERMQPFPEMDAVARSCFSPELAAEIAGAPADERIARFFAGWTLFEALGKAAGVGIVGWRGPAPAAAVNGRWAPPLGLEGRPVSVACARFGADVAVAVARVGGGLPVLHWHDATGTGLRPEPIAGGAIAGWADIDAPVDLR